MKTVVTAVICFTMLTACSGKPKDENGNVVKNDNVVCEYTKVTGSNRKKKICMTRQQAEVMRQQAQEDMKRAQKHINDTARQ